MIDFKSYASNAFGIRTEPAENAVTDRITTSTITVAFERLHMQHRFSQAEDDAQ